MATTIVSLAPQRDSASSTPSSCEDIPGEDPAITSRLKDKTFVIKLGGSTLEHQRLVLQDLIRLQKHGAHPVLVHGGGPSIDAWLKDLHIPVRFERGLRVTDARTLEVVCMVLRGQINSRLVLMASEMGGKAVGLSGTDGQMIRAHIEDERLGLVGEIDSVDPTLVQELINDGYIPIIAPLGLGVDGGYLNINADLVASHLAGALHAEQLIFLSNVAGIRGADGVRIAQVNEAGVQSLITEGTISGGMLPKVAACLNALAVVPSVSIVDGAEPHVLLRELCSQEGVGTTIVRNAA